MFIVELLIQGILAGRLADWFMFRHARKRLAKRHEVDCALRTTEGTVARIGRGWRYGRATLSPGHIHFVPGEGAVGKHEIDIDHVDRSNAHQPSGEDAPKWLSLELTVYRIVTPAGIAEWAVDSRLIEQAASVVTKVDSSTLPSADS